MNRFFNLMRRVAVFCAAAYVLIAPDQAFAEAAGKLKVGVYESAPFAFKNELGQWEGIAVDLWMAAAEDQGLDFEFIEVAEQDAVARLAAGELDLIAAGLPVTAGNEKLVDFSQPFFASDWAIAIMRKPIPSVRGALARIFLAWQFWVFVACLILAFVAVAILMWNVEARQNPEFAGDHRAHGISYAIYWSVAMMTGAGEAAPKSFLGRMIAIAWLAAAFFLSGAFTASVTTVLNVEHLSRKISSERDLPNAYVAIVKGDCETLLDQMNVRYKKCGDLKKCLSLLEKNRADAVVAGEPFIKYYAAKEYEGRLDIIPMDYEEVFYAIGLKPKSEIADQVNCGVLNVTSTYAWAGILRRYLEDL